MQLYLLRHGIAEQKSASGRDADRRLTPAGASALRDTLKRVDASPEAIVSSPYVRAIETARIASELLGYTGVVLTSSALCPEAAPVELWGEVRTLGPVSSILLVSHEPLLSAAASWMLGETGVVVRFDPGTIICLDVASAGPRPRGVMQRRL